LIWFAIGILLSEETVTANLLRSRWTVGFNLPLTCRFYPPLDS